ncbi:MAG: oxidoreductase [Gemmatimonadetes bacterium]|nr:oxidoreductase [Gemmatimonadota bacterium]
MGVPRTYTDVGAMFDAGGIDAVAIATPPSAQPEIVAQALSRSIPVFVEKLLAPDLDGARRLAELARGAGVANVIDYIFPELDVFRQARALIDAGFVGVPRELSVTWMIESHDNRLGLETWKTDPDQGGGALQHFGPHVMYYVEWLMGSIERLSSTLAKAPSSSRPGDTAVNLGLTFASGAFGSIRLSTGAPLGSGHRIEIYGSEGALVLVNESKDVVRGFRLRKGDRASGSMSDVTPPSPSAWDDSVDARVEPVSRLTSRFLDWIREGRETGPTFREGLRVQRLLDAAIRSHLAGASVSVAQG